MYEQLRHFVEEIEQIDGVMLPALESLIDLAIADLSATAPHPLKAISLFPLYFPPWLSETREPAPPKKLTLTTALCCKTLQRAYHLRRRFPPLAKKWEALEQAIHKHDPSLRVEEALASVYLPARTAVGTVDYPSFVRDANLMDEWFPFSSSHILWALLRGGEEKAYSGTAFICVFAMLWSLHGSEEGEGASIGLLPASAYVTGACWSVMDALCRVCEERAEIIGRLATIVLETEALVRGPAPKAKRVLPFRLDALADALHEFAAVAITPGAYSECAKAIEKASRNLTPASDPATEWGAIRKSLSKAIRSADTFVAGADADKNPARNSLLTDLDSARTDVVEQICDALQPPATAEDDALSTFEQAARARLDGFGIVYPFPTFTDLKARHSYWVELHRAAVEARDVCNVAVNALTQSVNKCAALTSADTSAIEETLLEIGSGNRLVASTFRRSLQKVESWCGRVVVPREMAHAITDDWTAFDPAELIAAAEIAVKSQQIASPVMIDAVASRALEAFRKDGSWLAGQPFYLDEQLSNGAWAPTADSLWTLARLLVTEPRVTSADSHIEQFIDWLDITRRKYEGIATLGGRKLEKGLRVIGWVSERQMRPERIDLWVTSFVINALLELRRLMEFRLWSLCEKRFTIIRESPQLEKIWASDLGAPHGERLHFRLAEMARNTHRDHDGKADYSMVLHGPPGSSKTAIAGAVSNLTWRGAGRRTGKGLRLVRVTPADFTHAGEAQIDYEAREIFRLLTHIRGATILFDEIDDLLRKRDDPHPPSFLKLIVPAMLNRLQDLRDCASRQEICFLIATNYVDNFEPALVRKGRIDWLVPLVYADRPSRLAIIEEQFRDLRKTHDWAAEAAMTKFAEDDANSTDFWPFKTIQSACREIERIAKEMPAGDVGKLPAEMDRLLTEHKATVTEFPYSDARVRGMQESPAFCDEVLQYLFAGASEEGKYLALVQERLSPAFGSTLPAEIENRATNLWRKLRPP